MDFFVLEKPESGTTQDRQEGTHSLKAEGFKVGVARRCASCGRLIGLLPWLPPYQVELTTFGSHYGDIIREGEDLIVSQRCMHIFQKNDIEGLGEFEAVEVVKVIHRGGSPVEKCPDYFKASVVDSRTTVDHEASGMQWAPTIQDAMKDQEWGLGDLECEECLLRKGVFVRRKQLVIVPETWTGEDIFHARGGVHFVVTSRLKDVCESNNIRNAHFVPAKANEVDLYPSESKQLLSHFRKLFNVDYDHKVRQDAYRTLAYVAGRPVGFSQDIDLDQGVDSTIIDFIKTRLTTKGLL
ncbi:MAG: hypothetical protein SFV23_15545 [Planctomycetaceae bacterium]|nr:hypothetical protein [Planctomycetaceae bacterium]